MRKTNLFRGKVACPLFPMNEKSFTLVELMITVTILSIGIVLVLRSFLSSASVLDTAKNRIKAVQFLEQKMSELQEEAFKEGEVGTGSYEEEVMINNRQAVFKSEIVPFAEELMSKELNEATLSLSWKEANIERNETLAHYFRNKE